MLPRKIYPNLKEHLKSKQITVITGMRRTGKTTLVKHLLSDIDSDNKMYFDFERIDNRDLFSEKNYEAIIEALIRRGLKFNKKTYIALDEIQLVRNIPSVIKYLYDNYDIKFIVTGSSSYYIKNLFTESLSGRKKIFELYPLDFGEYLSFKNYQYTPFEIWEKKISADEYERLKILYEDYIEYGGFPEVVLSDDYNQKKDLLNDIISSYVNLDIKSLADFRNEENVYNLLKMLASRVGTRLDYSKLSILSGLSRQTVQSYVDFFEKTFVITRLSVFTKNPDREIVKAKKIFFCDNGLLNILADINSGAKFENAIFNQLKHFGKLQYYALKNGREIDFIFDGKTAVEVKETPVQADKSSLFELAGKIDINECILLGRKITGKFCDYYWGGDIR